MFIWCAARSGSHLLYDLLSLHPGLATPATPSRAKKGLWGSLHHGDATPPELEKLPIPVEGVATIWEGAGLPARFRGYLGGRSVGELDVAKVRRAYRGIALQWPWGSSAPVRVLDKSPRYLLMVDLIEAVFPDARHVFLVRDPRAVVNSILRIYREHAEARQAYAGELYGHMYPVGWEAWVDRPLAAQVCWQTATLVRHGLELRRRLGDRASLVHYEQLVRTPHETAARLFESVGLPPFPALADLVPAQLPNYSPIWPEASEPVGDRYGRDLFFTDAERGDLRSLDDLVVELGYPRPGLP